VPLEQRKPKHYFRVSVAILEQSNLLTGDERRLKHAFITTANLKHFLEFSIEDALELVDSRNIDWHDLDVVL
jgi:hypothetical protein